MAVCTGIGYVIISQKDLPFSGTIEIQNLKGEQSIGKKSGQLFSKLGGDLKCSRNKPTPRWISSKWFRYGFLIFFLTLFGNMVFQTYLVGAGASSLREAIKLFWTFRVPWGWAYTAGTVADWVAQFSFGFYSLMLTSLLLGLIVMVLYKPRTWCTFCPMGTMTQGICKLKNNENK